MKNIKNKLAKKGWSEKDINKTVKIIKEAEEKTHPSAKIAERMLYSLSLVLALMGNFIISISLIPLIIMLNNIHFYIAMIMIGFAFGLLFELLIRGMENLKTKHHLILSTVIPVIAFINLVTVVTVSNWVKALVKIQNPENPFLVGIVYTVSFMIPYAAYQLFIKESSKES